MNDELRIRCIAITKSGSQCKNNAQVGNEYCYIHRKVDQPQVCQLQTAEEFDVAPAGPDAEKLQKLVAELESLVADLRNSVPQRTKSPQDVLQPENLVQFIKENFDKVTPEVAKDIAASFQGASKEDLLDPETWKGMAYMLNYSLRFQAEQWKQRLLGEKGEE